MDFKEFTNQMKQDLKAALERIHCIYFRFWRSNRCCTVMNNTTYNQLCRNMEKLGLGQMLVHLDEVTDFVTANNISFTEGLLKLSNYEVDFKEANASRSMIKAAAFPFVKEIKDYDFSFQPSVNEQEIHEMCTLGFLERNENIVFLGPSGVTPTAQTRKT